MRAPSPDISPSPIHLVLPARPDTIPRVRRAIEHAAAEARLPRTVVDDARLAVTEACTNVVRHAYDPDEAAQPEFEVRVEPAPGTMRVVVEDQGRGLGPSPDDAGPGLGLRLIAVLTSRLEVEPGHTRGTRLSMCFAAGPGRCA